MSVDLELTVNFLSLECSKLNVPDDCGSADKYCRLILMVTAAGLSDMRCITNRHGWLASLVCIVFCIHCSFRISIKICVIFDVWILYPSFNIQHLGPQPYLRWDTLFLDALNARLAEVSFQRW
jgi:hypothetical protein